MSESSNSNTIVKQKWENSLYMHWEYNQQELQKLLPDGLELDTFQNKAYLSVIALQSNNSKLECIPFDLPASMTSFNKISIRTYVKYNGQKGIYYIDSHSDSFLTSFISNKFLNMPCNKSNIQFAKEKNKFAYKANVFNLEFKVNRTKNKPQEVTKNTINHFVLNRDIIFTTDKNNNIISRQIEHQNIKYQESSILDLSIEELLKTNNLSIENNPPKRIHYINSLETDLLKAQ